MSLRNSLQVTVVYKSLPHYRVDFFEQLSVWLAEREVDLRVIVGQPVGDDVLKSDQGELRWAEYVRSHTLRIGRRDLVWQPVLRRVRGADLVIVEQANKLLVNPILMAWRRLGGPKLGFWGHGLNRNPGTQLAISEWVKRRLLRQCDWWFSYTTSTTEYLTAQGVPRSRISTVQNAIDVRRLRESASRVTKEATADLLQKLKLSKGAVCLYSGSLYAAKQLDFLIAAGDVVAESLPGFALLVVGDGPLRSEMMDYSESRPWLRLLGTRFNDELVVLASCAELLLMPGLVGLVVLDSFALRVPLVTTDLVSHSPEIDYLAHGVNGWMVSGRPTAAEFAGAVVGILGDSELLERMRVGCDASVADYTVEAMVSRFGAGVLECLGRL